MRKKEIAGYPGYYVTDDGRVWSDPKGRHFKTGMWLTLVPNDNGYLTVNLLGPDRYRRIRVHRLVLEAFVGPCPDGLEACHRNDIKTNNQIENLYWGTRRQNMRDAKDNGKHFEPPPMIGEDNPSALLKEEEVRTIIYEYRTGLFTQQEIADIHGMSRSHIAAIVGRKAWKHLWT